MSVHGTHCCPIHGCKYSHEDCPVVKSDEKPVYLCMDCAQDNVEIVQLSDFLNKTYQTRLGMDFNTEAKFILEFVEKIK